MVLWFRPGAEVLRQAKSTRLLHHPKSVGLLRQAKSEFVTNFKRHPGWPDGVSLCGAACAGASKTAGLRPADSRGRLSPHEHRRLLFAGSDSHAVEGTVDEAEGNDEEG